MDFTLISHLTIILRQSFILDQVLVLALSSEWNTKTRFYKDDITLLPGKNVVTLRALVSENACKRN